LSGLVDSDFHGHRPGLLCSVVCVILNSAVLVQNRLVTDGHRQTDTEPQHIAYRTSVASRGKNEKSAPILVTAVSCPVSLWLWSEVGADCRYSDLLYLLTY